MGPRNSPMMGGDQGKLELIATQKKHLDALGAASKVFLAGFPEMNALLKDQKGALIFDNESLVRFRDALDVILFNEWFRDYAVNTELKEWLELQDLTLCPDDPTMATDLDGKKVPVPSWLRRDLKNLQMKMREDLGMALEISKKNVMDSIEIALTQSEGRRFSTPPTQTEEANDTDER